MAMRVALFGICSAIAAGYMIVTAAHANMLSFVSDLVSTSAPYTETTHTINFTVINDVPPSGHIIIWFPIDGFLPPATFDYTDVDLAVSSGGGPFVDRDLATIADATTDGVSVTDDGTTGTIDITLNSTNGLVSGDAVQVLLGTNAIHGAVGTDNIKNPFAPGTYRINFATTDAANAGIDHSSTLISVVQPVRLSSAIPVVAPERSNGLPSGLIAANNTIIELSLQTDLLAHCRYATTTNVLYANMTEDFNPPFGTTHWVNTIGYQNDLTYTFYIRCVAFASGTANDDDYPITFTIKPTPISHTSIEDEGNISSGPTGNLGNGGAGDFPNGSNVLYLSSVTFSGTTIPNGTITELQDGVKVATVRAKSDGTFTATIEKLERGAYGFQLYVQDGNGLTSSLYATTLSIGQATDNLITNIVIPPTIELSADSASPGDTVTASGFAPPNATLQIKVFPQASTTVASTVKTYTASSSATGSWSADIDTKSFAKGVYTVQATAAISDKVKSGVSKGMTFSLGATKTSSACGTPDMNGDGKINLVDFSIFLLSWGTDTAAADYNCDGTVNLADFSIMLFNWTG